MSNFINSAVYKDGISAYAGVTDTLYRVVLLKTKISSSADSATLATDNVLAVSRGLKGSDVFTIGDASTFNALTLNLKEIAYTGSYSYVTDTAGTSAVQMAVVKYNTDPAISTTSEKITVDSTYYVPGTASGLAGGTIIVAADLTNSQLIYNGNQFRITASTITISAS